jgi:hypothetical protein
MRAAAFVSILLVGASAGAEGPGTRLGFLLGGAEQVGALGSRYGLGWTAGVEAGWMPTWAGFVWAITYAHYNASDDRDPVQVLTTWDLSLAFRGRALVRRTGLPMSVYGQLGAALLRASTALTADDSKTFFGPKLGLGVEAPWASLFFGIQADYGLLAGGPSQLQISLRFGGAMF